jgi:phosphomannomutase
MLYNYTMDKIKFTISGLRGVWQEGLNEEVIKKYISSFAVFLQKRNAKKIIVGRDARKTGPIILNIIKDIMSEAGIDVIDIEIVPTPTLIFLIKEIGFDGGVMISASHNPKEYNGIKFLNKNALYIDQTEVDEITSYEKESYKKISGGNYELNNELPEKHIDHILSKVDVSSIQKRNFRAVLDPINSSGYLLGPKLLEKLGVTPIIINGIASGDFAHTPEPLKENLSGLEKTVDLFKAHIGFAMDPDADRLVLCDETGKIIFEEYTLSLAIKSVLEKKKGDIVINLSTSNTNEDIANEYGVKTYRTKVGEANVVLGIEKYNAIIGGEGGGGVIYKEINEARDSLCGIALILEMLSKTNKTISQIVDELPKWEFIKTKINFTGDFNQFKEKIKEKFEGEKVNEEDGLRFDFSDRSWVQIRVSNTEPIIRIFGESKDKSFLEQKIEEIKSLI